MGRLIKFSRRKKQSGIGTSVSSEFVPNMQHAWRELLKDPPSYVNPERLYGPLEAAALVCRYGYPANAGHVTQEDWEVFLRFDPGDRIHYLASEAFPDL